MIELKDVSYSYSGQAPYLFHKLSHSFGSEKINVIRGPNGAGKSTLLRILSTLVSPTLGEVSFEGQSSKQAIRNGIRNRIAYSSGAPLGFYPRLNAYDNIRFFASIKGISISDHEIEVLCERVGLASSAFKKKFHEYSLGMRQRLHLARVLLPGCDFFLIDEITNGLDVDGVALCQKLLTQDLAGKVRILISHDANFVKTLSPEILDLRLP